MLGLELFLHMERELREWNKHKPKVAADAYVDADATVIGTVEIGSGSSIWPRAVLRGDVNLITIGKNTSIQDGTVCHTTRKSADNPNGYPLTVGDNVTVGHLVHLHGCTIENNCLIGSGSIVLDNAHLEEGVLLAAGSLVSPNKRLTAGLWRGSPAKYVRELTDKEKQEIAENAVHYVKLAGSYK